MTEEKCTICGTTMDALHIPEGKVAELCPGNCRGCAETRIENFDTTEDEEVKHLSNENLDQIIYGLEHNLIHFWKPGYTKVNIDEV
jgi:hypothetical protein